MNFEVTIASQKALQRLLSKTTALSKSQAMAAERRGKECECFLTRRRSAAKIAHPATIKGKLPARSNRPRTKFVQASEWKLAYTRNERSRSSL
ncbi:MAG: hypothetical protein IIV19_06280 [Bacteroidaceae bacterium]|nr:hypothetical protein [Bacteroidaceae bacterium]